MAPVSVTTVMTWGLGAGSVSSISGPAAVTSWTFAPMPLSARGRTPSFWRPTPPSRRPAPTSPVAQGGRATGLVQVSVTSPAVIRRWYPLQL